MELTPSERVKLNAAIVNAAKTGQPLSSDLQSLYNRAAELEKIKSTYPTRNISDVLVNKTLLDQANYSGRLGLGPQRAIEIVPHSGPASSLPVTDFDELYPKIVPIDPNEEGVLRPSLRQPFGKEFDFTQPPPNIRDTESVQERSQRFLNQYFQGESPGPVINPATNRPYGNELAVHDAMHDFANVGNTLRGEELITIAENVGATPLAARNVGLQELTQQTNFEVDPERAYGLALQQARQNARMGGRTLVQQRGAAQGSSLFRDANSIRSFLSPPISTEEFNTMAQRGQEFYDQVHANWNAFKHGGSVELPKNSAEMRKIAEQFMTNEHGPARVVTQQIAGGYNTGGIPYGNSLSLMNAPLVPTVDSALWTKELDKALGAVAPALQQKIKQEEITYQSPEQVRARALPGEWDLKKNALMSLGNESDPDFINFVTEKYAEQGLDINSPEFQKELQNYQALTKYNTSNPLSVLDAVEDTIGPRPFPPKKPPTTLAANRLLQTWSTPGEPDFFEFDQERAKRVIEAAVDEARGAQARGVTAAAPIDFRPGGRVYLNPANLGANYQGTVQYPSIDKEAVQALEAANVNSSDLLLDVATKAKQIEGYNKALPNIQQAIRTGFNTTTDLAGSIPLFDPAFRTAVEQGDVRQAATQVAKEYTAGLVAAPVVGAGMGVLQRVAPQAARVATGALGVARTANPIAVVSQLGGDAPQPRAVGTYRGATVYRNPQGALVAAPIGGKPMRLGQATLGGKPTFVPWGSVAGTRVGPRKVGRPWWDVGQFFGR